MKHSIIWIFEYVVFLIIFCYIYCVAHVYAGGVFGPETGVIIKTLTDLHGNEGKNFFFKVADSKKTEMGQNFYDYPGLQQKSRWV